MNQGVRSREAGSLILAAAVSFVLYLTSIGSLFFTLPLLLLDRRCRKRTTDTACVAALVLILGRNIFLFKDALNQSLTWTFISVSMFMPLSLILSAIVWVNKDDCRSVFERIIYSVLPSLILFVLIEAWLAFNPDALQTLIEAYSSTISSMLSLIFTADESVTAYMALVLLFALASLAVPLVVANHIGIAFIYEACTHPENEAFERKIRTFRVPEWFIYPFLALWAFVLVCCFVAVPFWISVPVISLALCTMLIYFLQGFAIIMARLRQRGSHMTAFKAAGWLLLILVIVQVVNIILALGITLTGVLENWIKLRKPEEFSNEDYS